MVVLLEIMWLVAQIMYLLAHRCASGRSWGKGDRIADSTRIINHRGIRGGECHAGAAAVWTVLGFKRLANG